MKSLSTVAILSLAVSSLAISAGTIRAQDATGPWRPPGGSSTANVGYGGTPPASHSPPGDFQANGSFDEGPPRLLAPVYQEGTPPQGDPRAPSPSSFDSNASAARREPDVRLAERPSPEGHATPLSSSIEPRDRSGVRLGGFAMPASHEGEVADSHDAEGGSPAASSTGSESSADPSAKSPGASRPLPPKPDAGAARKTSVGEFPFVSTFGALAAVLGAFFLFMWFQKKSGRRSVGPMPPEVVEPLGTVSFVPRQALHVVRFGGKILLINVTAGGSETLSEIDDPREAERILALCRRNRPDQLGRTFRELLGSSKDRPATVSRDANASSADRARGAAHA